MTRARVWYQAARPATLPASVSPVLVGVAISVHDGAVRVLPALGALLVAVGLQVGVNYANDYSDFKRGADTPARIGPMRAAASGLVAPASVRRAALIAFAVAGAAGLGVSVLVDARLLLLGAACLLAGWLYTGGPRPYGYFGLGELFVFVFFGLVATCGTVFVNEGRVTALALTGGVSMGTLATAILVLNNIRDLDTDAAAGKRTLAVRIGRPATRGLLLGLSVATYLAPLLAVLVGWSHAWLLLTGLSAPLLLMPLRASARREGPPLVAALKRVGRVQVVFALLWTLAVLVP